jgi:hypothetical protein
MLTKPTTDLRPEKKADTVIAQPVMTQWQALRQVGWVQPIDFLILFVVFMVAVVTVCWAVFAAPTSAQLLYCAILVYAILQLWTILLIFRCMHFVIGTQAYLNNLPYEAARIAMAGLQGRPIERPQ